MNALRSSATLLVGWLAVTHALAQQPAGTARNDALRGLSAERPMRFHLMDGSIVTGRLSLDTLEVETQFGQLAVPTGALDGFTPGMKSHPQLANQLTRLVEELGDEDFNTREAAQKALLEFGFEAQKELERHREDSDTERRKRIEYLMGRLEELREEDEFGESAEARPLIDRDTVQTTDFSIVGNIVPRQFTIESTYGMLTVKISDVRRAYRESDVPAEQRVSFNVDGSHIVFASFYQSKIRVERGDRVTITADGTITMTPWGNNAVSTPEGAANYGWYLPNQIPTGALVARIGTGGQVFKAGAKHNFTAERSGTLYFAIGMPANYANQQFPGEYNVKVRVRRK